MPYVPVLEYACNREAIVLPSDQDIQLLGCISVHTFAKNPCYKPQKRLMLVIDSASLNITRISTNLP